MKKLHIMFLTAAMAATMATGVYANPIVITNANTASNIRNTIQNNISSKLPNNITIESICEQIGWNGTISDCPILGDKPNTDKPNINKPNTDKPNINKPNTDKPNTDRPNTDKPNTDKPNTDKPNTDRPNTDKPNTNLPSQNTSQFAQEVVRLVNVERQKAGLSSLSMNTNIQKAAQVRAKEQEQSFSHTRPNGSNFSTVLAENGVNYRGSGENVAWGQKTPQAVMNDWMNSPGHRANILNENFTSIGVGYYQSSNGTSYWAQLFTY